MADLIDRQAAVDEIDEWIKAFRENGHKESAADACLIQDGIIQLPSAQPRKGKWIRTRTMTHDGELYCDQCEQEHPEQKIIWNFCPNCGCRMEEGDPE